jgi:CRISPR-associated endonuclease/helicase Cas3
MCAAHRKKLLAEMREKLKSSQRILCITTQLIEAGVDISFQAVIRSVAGLDSIAQAAGRCNRHGEAEQQSVYLINLSYEVEKLDKLPEIAQGKEITMQLLKERTEKESAADLLSHQSQTEYFKRYYQSFTSLLGYPVSGKSLILFDLIGANKNTLLHFKRAHGSIPTLAFKSSPKTVAEYFQVIDSPTTSVLVPYGDEGKELIADHNGELKPEAYAPTLKKAQQFMVNLFKHEMTRLQADGAIYPLLNGEILAIEKHAYSENFGVDLSSLAENEAIIF